MLQPMLGGVLVRGTFCDVVFVRCWDAGPAAWREAMGPDQAMALVRLLSHQERCAVEAFAARVDGSSAARFGEWQDGPGRRIEALLWSGKVLALHLPPREPAGAGGGGGGEAAASDGASLPDVTTKPSQSDEEDSALSYYELQLFDERDCPIAGVEVKVQTPLGTIFEVTDGDGCVRVDDAPAGFGHASVVAASLREALSGDEQRARRTAPLPEEPPWHVRTMRQLSQSVMLPDAERQKLMVITRTLVTHDAERHKWEDLHLLQDGPFHLLASQGMEPMVGSRDARDP